MSPRDPPSTTINDTTTSLALTAPSTGTTTISSSSDGEDAATTPVLQATASMCHHCFDVLLHHLKHRDQNRKSTTCSSIWRLGGVGVGGNLTKTPPSAASATLSSSSTQQPTAIFVEELPHENVECPLFVTWERKRPLSRFHHITSSSSKSHHNSSSSSSNNDNHHQQQQNGTTTTATASAAVTFELRGCIGTLSPRPLITSIGEYALISAFKDKRFDPVKLNEVPQLRVAVSLLVQYEECRDCHDWHVGIHGIVIRWRDNDNDDNAIAADGANDNNYALSNAVTRSSSSRFQRATTTTTRNATASSGSAASITNTSTGKGRDYSATYLPEVAADQGWDQQTAVSSLIRKAGFHGPISSDLLARVQCTRYQSSKHRLTFEEYIHQQQQQALLSSSSQTAAVAAHQSQQQQHGQTTTTSSSPTTTLLNDQLVAEAIRELGHLPKLSPGGSSGRDISPPTCRVL